MNSQYCFPCFLFKNSITCLSVSIDFNQFLKLYGTDGAKLCKTEFNTVLTEKIRKLKLQKYMILPVMNMLVNQLSDYIRQVGNNVVDPPVVLGNIGMSESLGGSEGYMQGRIVLSLVNIMEEPTLKNASPYVKSKNGFEIANPPAYINLYLLFIANLSNRGNNTNDIDYSNGLLRLSQIVEFFQSKRVFTVQNSPSLNVIQDPDFHDFRVSMELFSMTFEQINHLWGTLGGKQVPFVMYKAGILPVKRDLITKRGEVLQNIETNSDKI